MNEELTRQLRLERMLLRALLILKKDDFPLHIQARYEQVHSLVTRNGELSLQNLQSLTDTEVEELLSVVWDSLGLA